MAKKVIAFEDDPALRKQLEYIFYAIREEYNLVDAFPETKDLKELLAQIHPEVVIMDIQMTYEDEGLHALHLIKCTRPEIKVLMLTTFDDDEKIFHAICLGADGYMLKSDFVSSHMPHEAIRKSLRMIYEGGAYLTPMVARRIMNLFSSPSIADQVIKVKERFQNVFRNKSNNQQANSNLTRMQTLVLKKIIDGHRTSDIARQLKLSENTINTHIKAIYNILEVHSRSNAIKKALSEKWIH